MVLVRIFDFVEYSFPIYALVLVDASFPAWLLTCFIVDMFCKVRFKNNLLCGTMCATY